MLAALVVVRRLTELELGERAASVTVQLLAFGPMAVFLSAIYTESLFLALSAETFYAARRGKWLHSGGLGCLASMERSSGAVLLVPVLLMFFYGPRSDARPVAAVSRWRPRYRFSPQVLWSALIPLGAAAVGGYWAMRGFGLTAGVHAQELYQHHDLTLPFITIWDGVVAAWHQVKLVGHGGFGEFAETNQAVFQLVVLCLTAVLSVRVFRRLPLAYGAYSALGLVLLHLTAPTPSDPLCRVCALFEPALSAVHGGCCVGRRTWSLARARAALCACDGGRHGPVQHLAGRRVALALRGVQAASRAWPNASRFVWTDVNLRPVAADQMCSQWDAAPGKHWLA